MSAHAPAGEESFFREDARGVLAGETGGIGVAGAFPGLADRDDDGSFLRKIAFRIRGAVAEVISPALAFGGGVDKFAVFFKRQRALSRLGRNAEVYLFALRIKRFELPADGYAAVGHDLQILRDGSAVRCRRGERAGKQQYAERK